MAFPEHRLSSNHGLFLESNSQSRFFRRRKKIDNSIMLEEEIHMLRLKLEELAAEGNSLTADHVVYTSALLDQKINEYMNLIKRSR